MNDDNTLIKHSENNFGEGVLHGEYITYYTSCIYNEKGNIEKVGGVK